LIPRDGTNVSDGGEVEHTNNDDLIIMAILMFNSTLREGL
jgi:hypothetical protein